MADKTEAPTPHRIQEAREEGQVVRMVTRDFDALAKVVSARRKGEQWAVGVRLLTWLAVTR